MKVERIEIYVTELPVRVQRVFSSGSYDTGPPQQQLGKPHLPPALGQYETPEETVDVTLQQAPIYTPTTSRSLNLVA